MIRNKIGSTNFLDETEDQKISRPKIFHYELINFFGRSKFRTKQLLTFIDSESKPEFVFKTKP